MERVSASLKKSMTQFIETWSPFINLLDMTLES